MSTAASWLEFAAALGAFLAMHAVPVRPPVRPWLVARLGAGVFTAMYSLVSILVLGWLVLAAQRAPFVVLWPRQDWQALVPFCVMPMVCVLVALAVGRPNPFSFGGSDAGFDPARPGLIRLHRHPLLLALALWALSHLPPNGDLAMALLFGLFAVFACLGMAMIDRRRRRQRGAPWDLQREAVAATAWPRPRSWSGAALRTLAGLLVWLGLLALHPLLLGVSPLPRL